MQNSIILTPYKHKQTTNDTIRKIKSKTRAQAGTLR